MNINVILCDDETINPDVENAADLRSAVLNAYPAQMTEINALFDSYGY